MLIEKFLETKFRSALLSPLSLSRSFLYYNFKVSIMAFINFTSWTLHRGGNHGNEIFVELSKLCIHLF